MPLHRVNFAREYRERVFADFLAEHREGRTPNPDVLCNREIKFGVMPDYARAARREPHRDRTLRAARHRRPRHAATAEGARREQGPELLPRRRSTRREFAHVLFPLGDLLKSEVREIARRGRPARRREERQHRHLLHRRAAVRRVPRAVFAALARQDRRRARPRARVDTTGSRITRSASATGLHIGGVADGAEAPWYVARKDAERNELVVVQGSDHPLLFDDWLAASDAHWIGAPPNEVAAGEPFRCAAKIRYRQPDQLCTVVRTGDREVEVSFDQPQRTPTPGQYVVFYDGDRCLGGAVIERAGRTTAPASRLRAAG